MRFEKDALGNLLVHIKWFRPEMALIFFLCGGYSVALNVFPQLLTGKNPPPFLVSYPWVPRVIVFIVSVYFCYTCLSLLLNKTRITVSRSEVILTHGPLPHRQIWQTPPRISTPSINGLFLRTYEASSHDGPPETHYVLVLQIKNSKSVDLIDLWDFKDDAEELMKRIADAIARPVIFPDTPLA